VIGTPTADQEVADDGATNLDAEDLSAPSPSTPAGPPPTRRARPSGRQALAWARRNRLTLAAATVAAVLGVLAGSGTAQQADAGDPGPAGPLYASLVPPPSDPGSPGQRTPMELVLVNASPAAANLQELRLTGTTSELELAGSRVVAAGGTVRVRVLVSPDCAPGVPSGTLRATLDGADGGVVDVPVQSLGNDVGLALRDLTSLCGNVFGSSVQALVSADRDGRQLRADIYNPTDRAVTVVAAAPPGTAVQLDGNAALVVPAGERREAVLALQVSRCTQRATHPGAGHYLGLTTDAGEQLPVDTTTLVAWYTREVTLACP